MSEGDPTWNDRKDRIRSLWWEQLQRETPAVAELLGTPPVTSETSPHDPPDLPSPTTPAKRGAAASQAVTKAVRSVRGAWSRARGTSATPATATAPSDVPTSSPPSGTPAASTSSISDASTVWMATPLGFIEKASKLNIVDHSGSLVPGLSPKAQKLLEALAVGRNEPVEEVVQQIAEWFVEAEDERAEGPLGEAIEFYAENYCQ